jgi:hypothetical protein
MAAAFSEMGAPWSTRSACGSWIRYPRGSLAASARRVAAAARARPPEKSSASVILPRIASFVLLIGLAISYPASVTGFTSAPIASAVSEETFRPLFELRRERRVDRVAIEQVVQQRGLELVRIMTLVLIAKAS